MAVGCQRSPRLAAAAEQAMEPVRVSSHGWSRKLVTGRIEARGSRHGGSPSQGPVPVVSTSHSPAQVRIGLGTARRHATSARRDRARRWLAVHPPPRVPLDKPRPTLQCCKNWRTGRQSLIRKNVSGFWIGEALRGSGTARVADCESFRLPVLAVCLEGGAGRVRDWARRLPAQISGQTCGG